MLTISPRRRLSSSINGSHWVYGGRLIWSSSFSARPLRLAVRAFSSEQTRVANIYNMNLNEYMLTLDKPLGIRFAQTLDGKVYVEALAKHGNAESSRMIMVGDVLKKTSALFGDAMWDVEDFSRTMHAIKKRSGSVSLVLERPATPAHIHPLLGEGGPAFNCGRVGFATWNGDNVAMDPELFETEVKTEGKSGVLLFSSRFLRSKGFKALAKWKNVYGRKLPTFEVVTYFSDEETDGEVEWTHGNFSLEDYTLALKRSEKDLSYSHSLGMQVTKITGEIFVGSCLQTVADASTLAKDLGITAILNFQCKSEQTNWNIDGESIKQILSENDVLLLDFPIREVDSVDLRRKLPCAVAMLYRLLRQGHRVYVTCTTGLDRSPACVIAYLHWIRDVALQDAFDFVQSMHRCGPDRPALVWATWDLVAMAERGNHKGPATHTVQFVWNHGCREGEEVLLVGDFKGEWNEPIKTVHAGGPKYIVDLRLSQGKYYFKFIVEGQWRHSHSLPTEVDRWGNVNNVIDIGGVASTDFTPPTRSNMKAFNSIKVIERPLTENERFTLAFAARRMAFSICPIKFLPKS
ncbi:hypothetical protein L7F22_038795 [Adiantum nelumboides]|nr:hypothetical protein [Adiantum nelumboides]